MKRKESQELKRDVRKSIALIAERNIAKLENWMRRVARRDPARAADIFLRMIEYHVPKLARTEMTGADGEELPVPTIHVHFPKELARDERVVLDVKQPVPRIATRG